MEESFLRSWFESSFVSTVKVYEWKTCMHGYSNRGVHFSAKRLLKMNRQSWRWSKETERGKGVPRDKTDSVDQKNKEVTQSMKSWTRRQEVTYSRRKLFFIFKPGVRYLGSSISTTIKKLQHFFSCDNSLWDKETVAKRKSCNCLSAGKPN